MKRWFARMVARLWRDVEWHVAPYESAITVIVTDEKRRVMWGGVMPAVPDVGESIILRDGTSQCFGPLVVASRLWTHNVMSDGPRQQRTTVHLVVSDAKTGPQ